MKRRPPAILEAEESEKFMDMAVLEAGYAPWSEWKPEEYLSEYYAELMADEGFAMEFLVESLQRVPPAAVALDFGCGPTVHHLFPLVPKVQEIHLAEYLPANRAEVERWLTCNAGAHDWEVFSRETLRLEGTSAPTGRATREREEQTRERVTAVLAGDAGEPDPLGPDRRAFYPLVTTHYCAEGATNSKETWALYMRNIAGLVRPNGVLILSACGAADFYCVGDRHFPCAGVTGVDVLGWLSQNGFGDIDLRVRQVADHSEQGYGSVIFACATKQG